MTAPHLNRPDAPERRIVNGTAELVAMTDFVQLPGGEWTDGEVSLIRYETDGSITFVLTSGDFDPDHPAGPKVTPHTAGPYAPTEPVTLSRLIAPIGSGA